MHSFSAQCFGCVVFPLFLLGAVSTETAMLFINGMAWNIAYRRAFVAFSFILQNFKCIRMSDGWKKQTCESVEFSVENIKRLKLKNAIVRV